MDGIVIQYFTSYFISYTSIIHHFLLKFFIFLFTLNTIVYIYIYVSAWIRMRSTHMTQASNKQLDDGFVLDNI
jgi:hypothetical protein